MLGELELQLVQKIDTEGDQVLAEHGVPGLEGDFLQGLGRRAERLTLNGVLTGPEAGEGLKMLREKFRAAEPVSFVADISTATKVDKVLIEEMGVRDLAGKPERFEYAFALREFLPPPPAQTEEPPPPPPEPEPPPPPSVETGTLIVEVIVEGQPDFDFSTVTVTLDGTQDDGTRQSRNLVNRSDGTWTETEMPPGQYTVRAVVTAPEPMSGETAAAVRGGQTTRVQITLRPGAVVARAFVIHFRFDSAFVEPCMLEVLERVFERAQANPTEKILVVGHTDLVGSDAYNQSLSERRGRSIFALLTFATSDDLKAAAVEDWNNLRRRQPGGLPTINDNWGAREYQYMLQELGHYSGNIDEIHGAKTDAAVRAFQAENGLAVTGLVDDATWPKLNEAYLAVGALDIPEDRFFQNAKDGCNGGMLKWLGCGEQDPVKNTQDAWRPNRRTEILFVRANQLPCDVPPPLTLNLPAAGAVSPTWCLGPGDENKRACFSARTAGQEGKFLIQPAEPDKVTVSGTITFDDGTPVANAKYALIAADGEFLHTDAQGNADLGERPQGPLRGRPIQSRADANGRFTYPKQTPAGVYVIEIFELSDPQVARESSEPPHAARGNVICTPLEVTPSPTSKLAFASDTAADSGVATLDTTIQSVPVPPPPVDARIDVATDLVMVKKSYTAPARVRVVLRVTGTFPRTGILSPSGNVAAIKLFTTTGVEIRFTNGDNEFTGRALEVGVVLMAEGVTASAALNDYVLTLDLAPGPTPIGTPGIARLTAVSLTLDVCVVRTVSGVDPPALPQPPLTQPAPGTATDKWFGGRLLNVQDDTLSQERALLIVRRPLPASFIGPLVLRQVQVNGTNVGALDSKAALFASETPNQVQPAHGNPHQFNVPLAPGADQRFFLQGQNPSLALRDTGFQLGIAGGENDGDRIALTIAPAPVITLASRVVVVKKPHTTPARQLVTLRTQSTFSGTGTLSRSGNTAAIKLFDALTGGNEIGFNGTDNLFTDLQLDGAGVSLFAEGAATSGALNDYELTLALTPAGTSLAGNPATARMTAVELTLDVALSRTSPADPAVMSAADKVNIGRHVQVRDPSFTHERAMIIVRQPRPAAFTGTLLLSSNNAKVEAFAAEVPASGQPVLPRPQLIPAASIPATDLRFFVEATARSASVRDTGFRLGIQNLETNGDRVSMTAVQIEVADTDAVAAPSVAFVRFGLWDNAFRAPGAAGGPLFNDAAEANNFAGADTRRFHIRVRDVSARNSGHVNVDWRTLNSGNNNLDNPPNNFISLVETPANSGVFISRGLILATDNQDRDQPTHHGLPAAIPQVPPVVNPAGNLRARGQSNHRVRRGSMTGSMVLEYRPAAGLVLPVRHPLFQRTPDFRRRLPLQILVLRVAVGGASVVPTGPTEAIWTRDLPVLRETYERIGIAVDTVVAPGTAAANIVTVAGDSIMLIDPPAGVNPLAVRFQPTNDEAAIGTSFPGLPNTIRLIYTGGLSSGSGGESWPDANFAGQPQVGASFINGGVYGLGTVPHEIGHVLTNKSATVNTGHYVQPAAPAGNRLHANQNLMANLPSPAAGGVNVRKRLWDAIDGDSVVNQFTAIRGSRFTRPF